MFLCVLFSVLFVSVSNGNRIAGGEVTEAGDYPFAVALMTNGGQGSYSQGCGGTLLTRDAILSAASCFYTNQQPHPVLWWRARVGTTSVTNGGSTYLVRSITPNTGFNPATLANDIAVLRTALAIPLVPGSVETARIAGAAYTFTTNQVVTAIGWGAVSNQIPSSGELRTVDVFVVNQQTCSNRYSELGVTITEEMVCAGWLDVGVIGQCQGDNGSPLLSGKTVVGVFSRAEGCAQGYQPCAQPSARPSTHASRPTSTG